MLEQSGVRPEHRVAPLELTVTITQYQIVSGTNKTIWVECSNLTRRVSIFRISLEKSSDLLLESLWIKIKFSSRRGTSWTESDSLKWQGSQCGNHLMKFFEYLIRMKIVLNWEVIRIPFQGKSKSHCTFKRDTKNFMLELENSLLIRYRNRLKYLSSYISQIISRIWWFVVRNELSSDVPTISVHKLLFSLSQTEHWATSGQQAGEALF